MNKVRHLNCIYDIFICEINFLVKGKVKYVNSAEPCVKFYASRCIPPSYLGHPFYRKLVLRRNSFVTMYVYMHVECPSHIALMFPGFFHKFKIDLSKSSTDNTTVL